MPLRIAIFDDNKNIRESMELLLQTEKEFEVVGSFAHVLDCVQEIRQCKPDVVLMDIEMPEMTGIEAVRNIKKEFPQMQIMMQTVHDDDDRVFDSICAGASAYILKNQADEKLIEAIKEMVNGGSPMSPAIARKVLRTMQAMPEKVQTGPQADYNLSAREKEVLAGLISGLSYKMIASQLFISNETVRSHIKRIYQKLQVARQADAVQKAVRERIV